LLGGSGMWGRVPGWLDQCGITEFLDEFFDSGPVGPYRIYFRNIGTLFRCWQPIENTVFPPASHRCPGALHRIVIRGAERKAIFKDGTDREDFIERLSSLLQEMDVDTIGRYRSVRGHRRCVPLSWHRRKELARRFNVDRSAINRATHRVSRDPELLSATKTIQREPELEINQHWNNVIYWNNYRIYFRE